MKNINPNKYYLSTLTTNNNYIKNSLLKKSSSGNNMKINTNLNFLEGINI
jgi:hypothetical protein